MSQACAFHCPFALTFPCSLIFRRDNYCSDTLERSVIWGFSTMPVLPLLFPLGPSGSHHSSSQWEPLHPPAGSPAPQPHCFHWCRDESGLSQPPSHPAPSLPAYCACLVVVCALCMPVPIPWCPAPSPLPGHSRDVFGLISQCYCVSEPSSSGMLLMPFLWDEIGVDRHLVPLLMLFLARTASSLLCNLTVWPTGLVSF